MPEELAPAYRALFDKAGPILRYRILRDVAHQDDTYFNTLVLRQQIEKLPQVREVLSRQQPDGSWGDFDATEDAVLRLCEFGLSDSDAVRNCGENYLLQHLSERTLRLLVRAGFSVLPEVQQGMLKMLNDWSVFLTEAESGERIESSILPTWDAYDAICFHRWSAKESKQVVDVVTRLFVPAVETTRPEIPFKIRSKEEYLAQPERLLYELELSARLGVTALNDVTRWMLEELEAHQDADGFFRFNTPETSSLPWYFPLDEPDTSNHFTTDWTFRGMLIFGALEYDV